MDVLHLTTHVLARSITISGSSGITFGAVYGGCYPLLFELVLNFAFDSIPSAVGLGLGFGVIIGGTLGFIVAGNRFGRSWQGRCHVLS